MFNSLSDFLLRDHAPTQITLYSLPVVNVLVRFFHSIHSLDSFENNDFSSDNIDQFEAKKARFQSYLTTAIQIQIALAITGFVLGILFPPHKKMASLISASFALGALSSFLCDRLMRSENMAPTIFRAGGAIIGY